VRDPKTRAIIKVRVPEEDRVKDPLTGIVSQKNSQGVLQVIGFEPGENSRLYFNPKTQKVERERFGNPGIVEEVERVVDSTGKMVEIVTAYQVTTDPVTGEEIRSRLPSEDRKIDLSTGTVISGKPFTSNDEKNDCMEECKQVIQNLDIKDIKEEPKV
jgi:hypothetical protein